MIGEANADMQNMLGSRLWNPEQRRDFSLKLKTSIAYIPIWKIPKSKPRVIRLQRSTGVTMLEIPATQPRLVYACQLSLGRVPWTALSRGSSSKPTIDSVSIMGNLPSTEPCGDKRLSDSGWVSEALRSANHLYHLR